MSSLCGAKCEECPLKNDCAGCSETCGSPFGGSCIAASYIKTGGREAYAAFKSILLAEVNAVLKAEGLPLADGLYELAGKFVNLEYPLPNGQRARLLDDRNIYLGCQIEFADLGICYGVVADTGFILVCSYSVNGSDPEIIIYKRR